MKHPPLRLGLVLAVLALIAPGTAQARSGLSRAQAAGDTTRAMSLAAGHINDTVQNFDGWYAIPTYPRNCGQASPYIVYCTGFMAGSVYDPNADATQDVECTMTIRWYKFQDGSRRGQRIGNPYCWTISGYYSSDGRRPHVDLSRVTATVGAMTGTTK